VAPPPLDDDLNMPQNDYYYATTTAAATTTYEPFPTNSPSKSLYTANEYETDVEDFAEHDDFFESKPVRMISLLISIVGFDGASHIYT
jgi:hypothetical protein